MTLVVYELDHLSVSNAGSEGHTPHQMICLVHLMRGIPCNTPYDTDGPLFMDQQIDYWTQKPKWTSLQYLIFGTCTTQHLICTPKSQFDYNMIFLTAENKTKHKARDLNDYFV